MMCTITQQMQTISTNF